MSLKEAFLIARIPGLCGMKSSVSATRPRTCTARAITSWDCTTPLGLPLPWQREFLIGSGRLRNWWSRPRNETRLFPRDSAVGVRACGGLVRRRGDTLVARRESAQRSPRYCRIDTSCLSRISANLRALLAVCPLGRVEALAAGRCHFRASKFKLGRYPNSARRGRRARKTT